MLIRTTKKQHLASTRVAIRKTRTDNDKSWRARGEIRTLAHYWWACKMTRPWFFRNFNVELLSQLAVPLLGYITAKRTKNGLRPLYTNVCSSIIHNNSPDRYLSIAVWINKVWSSQTMEYYSATKRNKGLTHAQHGRTLKTLW